MAITNEFLNYEGLQTYNTEIKNYINEKAPQSDWAQTDSTKADFIKNKPELGTLAAKDEVSKTDLAADVQESLDATSATLQSHKERIEAVETAIDNSVMIDKSFGIGPDTVAEGDHTHGNLELQMQSIEDLINIDYNDKSDAVEFFTDVTPSHTLWEVSNSNLVTDVIIEHNKYVCTTNTPEEGVKAYSMYDMVDIVKGKTIVAVANISSENYTLFIKMYNGTAWSFGRVGKNNRVVSIDVPADLANFELGLEYTGTGSEPETCEMTNFALYLVNDVSITSTANIPNRNYTIWSWGNEGINDPEGFASFCKAYRINRVYQCIYDDWSTYDIKTFVGTMQKNKILVNWLTGEANWILTENHGHITEEIQKVVNYNMSVQNDYEKIGTVQFDIEPYTIDLWDTDKDSAVKLYQDAILLAYEGCIANQLSLNACVPTWFEQQMYNNEYGQGNLFDFVSKHSSSTVLMSYSTSYYVSMSEDEIRIGSENGKNVAVGLETHAVSDRVTEDMTFVNHPIEDLYRAFEELYLVYKMYSVSKGIEFVIHYYTSFKEYVEKFNLTTGSTDILDKLTTTDKTDLISAINELDKRVDSLGNLASKSIVEKADLSASVQESLDKADTALQSYTETDPTVPAWAKASSKPTYTASEVGAVPTSRTVNGKALSKNITLSASDVDALPDTTTLANLTGDASHRTVTDTEKATWNAKSNFSGSYNDLTNKPTLGTLAGKSQVEKTDLSTDLQAAIDRVDFANGGTMGGSLTINGDLTVNGTSTTVETYNENVNVEDNTITLRYNAITGLQNDDYTGIIAQNYDGANNGMLVFDNSGTAYVGDVGDLQPLATRNLTTEDNGELVSWDAANQTLVKAPVTVENIVTKDNFDSLNTVLSTNTNNTEVAYVKDVPADSVNYAEVNKIGGMTYKSKNLIPFPYATPNGIYDGVEFTANAGGSISVSGTANSSIEFVLFDFQGGLPDGDYTIRGTVGNIKLYINKTIDGVYSGLWGETSFRCSGNVTAGKCYLYIGRGETVNGTIYPMLNEGSTALPYEPYFEGLRSAKVTEVKSVGVNLLNVNDAVAVKGTIAVNGGSIEWTYPSSTNPIFACSVWVDVIPNTDYTIKWGSLSANTVFVYSDNVFGNAVAESVASGRTFNSGNYSRLLVGFYSSDASLRTGTGETISNIRLNEGTTAQPYTPYVEHTLPIPEAVQALEGYGWGVNADCYNYITWNPEGNVKTYTKAVKAVDMGTLNWKKSSLSDSHYRFLSTIPDIKKTVNAVTVGNILCDIADVISNSESYGGAYGIAVSHNSKQIFLSGAEYDEMSEASFKAAMSGVMLYYELAEPIVTDISDLITADNLIAVEGGGTLTFENEYGYAVPSEVVFYNEKAEIVAADKIVGNLIGVSTRAISDEDGNSIANTYMKKSNALEVISGLSETQLQKLISLIDTIEIQ